MLKKRLHTEVGEGGTEEDGREFAGVHQLLVKFRVRAVQKFHVLEELIVEIKADALAKGRVVHAHVLGGNFLLAVHGSGEERDLAGLAVIHALEALAGADGPVDGARRDA